MSYEMMGSSPLPTSLRPTCDPYDLPTSSANFNASYVNSNSNNFNNGFANSMASFSFKPPVYSSSLRPQLSVAEQAELEFELRYRGNMIVDQQRKIQQLEEELKRARDQMDVMNSQITSYEQERNKERKKPQSRYWTPDEHQRFLEALNKFGHKDVKAISMHVSTRNATQVRTHAQKYFLRLERERRKRGDDASVPPRDDGYNSSGDELYGSSPDQSLSPMDEHSPPSISPTPQATVPVVRRRRSGSLITPSMGKQAPQHKEAVLAELPSWTGDDYDAFVKGLNAVVDKHEDLGQVCLAIQEGFLPVHTLDDVERCYRALHKLLKQKPTPLSSTPNGSPKRRRTIKTEGLSSMMSSTEMSPLPAVGSLNIVNSPPIAGNNVNNNMVAGINMFGSFMNGISALPPPQYTTIAAPTPVVPATNAAALTSLQFQAMPPRMDYPTQCTLVSPLQQLGMGDVSSSAASPLAAATATPATGATLHHGWTPLSFSFDLHSNSPSALSAFQPNGQLVSSHN